MAHHQALDANDPSKPSDVFGAMLDVVEFEHVFEPPTTPRLTRYYILAEVVRLDPLQCARRAADGGVWRS